jgi:transposase
MILLSSRGYTVPQIAAICECDEATVRSWIERFEASGVEGLRDRPRSGRPRKAEAVAQQAIRQERERTPADAGYLFSCWTLVTLARHLATHCGLHLSRATVRCVAKGAEGPISMRPALPRSQSAAMTTADPAALPIMIPS